MCIRDRNVLVAVLFFGLLFMVVTSRIVMAQSMISNVVSQNQRGSFMSVNGSMQQLGQGMASLIAGVIVKTNRTTHQLSNYNWVGYLSIAVLIVAVIIGNKICLLYTSPSPRDRQKSRMPSSA